MMTRRIAWCVIAALCFSMFAGTALARDPEFSPGAPGIGDEYFELDGNGGYDVQHYQLDVSYDPDSDVLTGVATITAMATQNLSSFNFDFVGLEISSVTVDGSAATWSRDGGELTIVPARGIRNNTRFVVVVAYSGIPETLPDGSGFIHTHDGALVVGQPDVAATWFPANDHPMDDATFTLSITVPAGIEAIANGDLVGQTSAGGWTTWEWRPTEPMATYLVGMGIGEFELNSYRVDKIQYLDAIDPDLMPRVQPTSGEHYAYSQQADLAYKRLTRTIDVPAAGATLSFWANVDTEFGFDFFFVEARTSGEDDWTTLPDVGPEPSNDQGLGGCPYAIGIHPFLEHYQTVGEEACSPEGSTGEWWATSGSGGGWQEWTVDLGAWAGGPVEVSLTYMSDDIIQFGGVFIDDITVSTGEGTTSFEDGNGGWEVSGPPADSPGNLNDWMVATSAEAPPSLGENAQASLARQDEIVSFLEGYFGPYPFHAGGGIVDDPDIFFALENQTRPIYWKGFFTDQISGDSVVVHELAHQWFGDDLRIEAWQHIWLNEGFATYAEWLWLEREGIATVDESMAQWVEFWTSVDPDFFWGLAIGDPGPDNLFHPAVYYRGAMTLHELRREVGDTDFFKILSRWAQSQAGGTVTTDEFIALAEKISGQQLDALFDEWLSAGMPQIEGLAATRLAPASAETWPYRVKGEPVGRK
jgi:hypothetical protein